MVVDIAVCMYHIKNAKGRDVVLAIQTLHLDNRVWVLGCDHTSRQVTSRRHIISSWHTRVPNLTIASHIIMKA